MGARLSTPPGVPAGHDADRFDGFCEHLPVRTVEDLSLGSKVLGAPAWDPDFNTADLPMMLDFDDMPPRYRKRLLG